MEANVLAEHALFLNENTGQDQIHHKDRIMLLTNPQIPVQLKSVPVCLAMCFG